MPPSNAKQAHPLQWPIDWKRTPSRTRAPYKVPMSTAHKDLVRNLKLLGGRDIVLSSNIPLRSDGIPYMDDAAKYQDPGVAVYWTSGDGKNVQHRVIACDRWDLVHHNIRACGLAIEGMRAVQRSGASQVLDKMFLGLIALAADNKRSWRDVLGFAPGERPDAETIDVRWRKLAVERHPDRGGSNDGMVELNAAHREAHRETAA